MYGRIAGRARYPARLQARLLLQILPLAFVVAVFLAVSAVSQEPRERQGLEQADERVIRAAARLVEISVVALDRRGNPVTDLEPSDFIIREDGEGQEIAVFQMHKIGVTPATELPSGMVTNRHELKGAPSGVVTVILLDGLNTRFEDRAFRTELL